MIKDLYILNDEYDLRVAELNAGIEELEVQMSGKTPAEIVTLKKQVMDLVKEIEIYGDLKKNNIAEINKIVDTETQTAWLSVLTQYGLFNRESEQKVKEVINKAVADIQALEQERENNFKSVDRTDLDFLLRNYPKIKGTTFHAFAPPSPNTKTIKELELIKKNTNWK